MTLDRPVHAAETADGTASLAVARHVALGFAAYGGLAQMSPRPTFGAVICARTKQVQDAILAKLSDVSDKAHGTPKP